MSEMSSFGAEKLPTTEAVPLAPVNGAAFGIHVGLLVTVRREPRHRCPTCHLRRVLYRIDIGAPGAVTGAECWECWIKRA